MFYDDKLMNSKTLSKVWKAANNIENSDDDVKLLVICKKLDEWLGSEEERPSRRLSLRTSAILIDGAAKLYKQGMQKLFEDIDGLDKAMSAPKRHRGDTTDSSESNTYTNSVPTPEKIRRRTTDTNLDTSQMNETGTKDSVPETFGAHPPICSNKTFARRTESNNNNIFTEYNENSSQTEPTLESRQETQKEGHEDQTPLSFVINETERDGHSSSGFDENLPFGCILVYDSYRSRIPSKIIFSSLNADVTNVFE